MLKQLWIAVLSNYTFDWAASARTENIHDSLTPHFCCNTNLKRFEKVCCTVSGARVGHLS